jgi:hypothetical protein
MRWLKDVADHNQEVSQLQVRRRLSLGVASGGHTTRPVYGRRARSEGEAPLGSATGPVPAGLPDAALALGGISVSDAPVPAAAAAPSTVGSVSTPAASLVIAGPIDEKADCDSWISAFRRRHRCVSGVTIYTFVSSCASKLSACPRRVGLSDLKPVSVHSRSGSPRTDALDPFPHTCLWRALRADAFRGARCPGWHTGCVDTATGPCAGNPSRGSRAVGRPARLSGRPIKAPERMRGRSCAGRARSVPGFSRARDESERKEPLCRLVAEQRDCRV